MTSRRSRTRPVDRPPASTLLDRRTLWKNAYAEVSEAIWDRHRHPADREGVTPRPAIVASHSGSYVRRVGDRHGVGDPGHVSL